MTSMNIHDTCTLHERVGQLRQFLQAVTLDLVRQITGIILVNLDLRYIENVLTDFDCSGPLLKETS